MPNRLATETSPYLRQHADNPVDWYPWGPEALALARRRQRPIFLSIGYSACHWCHVMERESFQHAEVAAYLNEHFVPIKVDREERPDLDSVYMRAVQALTGRGGWPLTVFLTPSGQPFHGGTYYPPEPSHGLPGFLQVLRAVHEAWLTRRLDLNALAEELSGNLGGEVPKGDGGDTLNPEVLDRAIVKLLARQDERHGGWGTMQKFPHAMVLEFLLMRARGMPHDWPLEMAQRALDAMAEGGIYDHLGGGFHRYAVDPAWRVPHFEKMLYDNALLARVYLHAYQYTGEERYRQAVEGTLDYVERVLSDPAGGFYAAQDADSEGQEGRYFVWRADEVRHLLGDEAEAFATAYAITVEGDLDGGNVLRFEGDREAWADLQGARAKLLRARQGRVPPAIDGNVVAGWNGLMLAAYAEASWTLGSDRYLRMAERNAAFLLREMVEGNRLSHVWSAGEAKLLGYLDDYAGVIEGLLTLYQATYEPLWFMAARDLADTMVARFAAPDGGFYDTSDEHEELVARPRELQDNATPSGNALAVTVLQKLGALALDTRHAQMLDEALARMQPLMAEHPLGFGQWLQALSFELSRPLEIAIVGQLGEPATSALIGVARDGYRPFQVVAAGAPSAQGGEVPLLRERELVDGVPAAYVCRDLACQLPVTEPEELRELLAGNDPRGRNGFTIPAGGE